MINVEIIKVHAGQILPCGRVTGNKEFTIGDPINCHRLIQIANLIQVGILALICIHVVVVYKYVLVYRVSVG